MGGERESIIFRAPDLPAIAAIPATANPVTGLEGVIPLKLLQMERLKGDIIWLRYEVK